jgi:ketosteroid isomerase-like protein
MSRENVEIVREMYEAYRVGDFDRALAHFHPDVSADFTVRGDTGITEGRAALRNTVAQWITTWDDYSERIEEIRDLGDTVFVAATQRGRGKGSGLEVDNSFGQLYTLEDGLITTVRMYGTPEQALEAAGLSEPPRSG